jgi:hypothetical protein
MRRLVECSAGRAGAPESQRASQACTSALRARRGPSIATPAVCAPSSHLRTRAGSSTCGARGSGRPPVERRSLGADSRGAHIYRQRVNHTYGRREALDRAGHPRAHGWSARRGRPRSRARASRLPPNRPGRRPSLTVQERDSTLNAIVGFLTGLVGYQSGTNLSKAGGIFWM